MAEAGITIHADEFIKRLVRMQRPALDKPVALGLADTAKSAKTKAASLIARRTGLKSATVKERIYYPFVRVGAYSVTIRSSRRPIPLIEFPNVAAIAAGVRTSAWGRSQTLGGAFIATMPSGRRDVFRRRTSRRLPIRKLWGPTIWGTFRTPEVQSVIATTMRDRLKASLLRRIAAAQRRG